MYCSYSVQKAPQTHIHVGPYWDYAKIENLGKQPTQISVEGFLSGDVALVERAALQAMILTSGAGLLTIPTYGIFYAVCINSVISEDISDMIQVQLQFMETESPLGNTISSLMSGNIPSSLADAVSNLQSNVVSSFASIL